MTPNEDPRLPKADAEQFDKFVKAARELGADDDEKRWEERLKKVAKQKVEPDEAKRRP